MLLQMFYFQYQSCQNIHHFYYVFPKNLQINFNGSPNFILLHKTPLFLFMFIPNKHFVLFNFVFSKVQLCI